jgi:hypothetical protein
VICLSFDTDHLDEARMREFLDDVAVPGAATFFCTQRYASLGGAHELCPHPFLQEGVDWEKELASGRADFPAAVGWRSHSCVYSHLLAQRLAQDGYRYVSIRDELGARGLAPYREAWGVWHLPIFYMDNLDFSYSRFWGGHRHRPFAPELIDAALSDDGLYVFDFHPIHLMLNSTSADAYLERRAGFVSGGPMERLRCDGYGARDFYDDLSAAMQAAGVRSQTLREALTTYVGDATPTLHRQSA